MRRLRITSDGNDAHVYDAETGQELEYVEEARIELKGGEFPIVWLKIWDAELDIIATEGSADEVR